MKVFVNHDGHDIEIEDIKSFGKEMGLVTVKHIRGMPVFKDGLEGPMFRGTEKALYMSDRQEPPAEKPAMMADLVGKTFGKLTVKRVGTGKNWFCRCAACGSSLLVPYYRLVNGSATSCGCDGSNPWTGPSAKAKDGPVKFGDVMKGKANGHSRH
jgi:hypothetical protein